jgi:1-acyl-sn-glycerol-3-phosphate acyltransferase
MLYYVSKFLVYIFFKLFVGFNVEGAENVPQKGGFILAPNHVSYMDPPVVGTACPRRVYFMAKVELFKVPILSQWMKGVGTIPLKHGAGDRGSFKKAVELLKNGECVCIFPEGMRVPPGKVKEAEPGIAFLAKIADVPVVPAAILGTQPWYRKFFGFIPWFHPLKVRFGKPIKFDFEKLFEKERDKNKVFQEIAEQVLAEIRKLKSIDNVQ